MVKRDEEQGDLDPYLSERWKALSGLWNFHSVLPASRTHHLCLSKLPVIEIPRKSLRPYRETTQREVTLSQT